MTTTRTPATETGWMNTVIDCAHFYGWTVAHFRPAKTAHGWRTPIQADGKGFPDLFMTRTSRAIAAELKRDANTEHARQRQLDPDQARWLNLLAAAGIETHIWRPSDWDQVLEALR